MPKSSTKNNTDAARAPRERTMPKISPAQSVSPDVREMNVADLKPAPYNPRKISSAALAGLTKSMDRFGYVEPIVCDVIVKRWEDFTGQKAERSRA